MTRSVHATNRLSPRPWNFVQFLWCWPFFWMIALLVIEAALAASTTALIIQAGHDVAEESFLASDFIWIVAAQSASYLVGASSWIFAERAGFGAFGRYMLRFTRDNRHKSTLLANKLKREEAEPFLTNETFHILFELIYELEHGLKMLFSLVFNAIVLGVAVDAGLPVVYLAVFVILMVLQWSLRKPLTNAYLQQQRTTNRMTAHTYYAWDNIFSGNRYNFRLWHADLKSRLRDALGATIRAIMAREGLAAVGGIIGLAVIFTYLAYVSASHISDTALLIAMAATLPRQIELSSDVHGLAAGWNDLSAIWTRIGGACRAMDLQADEDFEQRIKFEYLQLHHGETVLDCPDVTSAAAQIMTLPNGRIQVRGKNGAGKSTLLAALKQRFGSQSFYWPTTERLVFDFARAEIARAEEEDDEEEPEAPNTSQQGFSSGERQLHSLREIVENTQAHIYLLDEWDANLDPANKAQAEILVQALAARAVVVEISHRDKK